MIKILGMESDFSKKKNNNNNNISIYYGTLEKKRMMNLICWIQKRKLKDMTT